MRSSLLRFLMLVALLCAGRFVALSQPDFHLVPFAAGASFQAGEVVSVRWSNAYLADAVRLWYSLDAGAHWIHVDDADPHAEYRWKVPIGSSSQCLLRADCIRYRHDTLVLPGGDASDLDDRGTRIATGRRYDSALHQQVRCDRLWDARTGALIREWTPPREDTYWGGPALSPSGDVVVFSGYDRAQCYNATTGARIWAVYGLAGAIRFSPDGGAVYGGTRGFGTQSNATIRSAANGEEIASINASNFAGFSDAHLSPNGGLMVLYGGAGGTVFWDLHTWALKTGPGACAAFHPDSGSRVAFGQSYGAGIYERAGDGFDVIRSIDTWPEAVEDIAYTPDGGRLLLVTRSGISICSAETGRILRRIPVAIEFADRLTTTRDMRRVAVSSGGQTELIGIEDSLAGDRLAAPFSIGRPMVTLADVDFGVVDIAGAIELPTRKLRIENKGLANINVDDARFVGGDSDQFDRLNYAPGPLPGTGDDFIIYYVPRSGGTHHTRLRVILDDGDTLYAGITASSPQLPLWPMARKLWSTSSFCGDPVTDQWIVLHNLDVESWSVRPRIVSTSSDGAFTILDTGLSVVAPGDDLPLRITFTAAHRGEIDTALVALDYNGPGSPIMLVVYGVCYVPAGVESPVAPGAGNQSTITALVAPNPLSARGELRYTLPHAGRMRLMIYDHLGRLCCDRDLGMQPAGHATLPLDAHELPSGAVRCVLQLDAHRLNIPLVVVR